MSAFERLLETNRKLARKLTGAASRGNPREEIAAIGKYANKHAEPPVLPARYRRIWGRPRQAYR